MENKRLIKALSEILIQGCLPLASMDCFKMVYPDTDEIPVACASAIYFFITFSFAASDGSSFREIIFCILSGFYPEN